MNRFLEFLPTTLPLVLNLFLLIIVLMLALTRLRGTWFAVLAGSSMMLIFMIRSTVDQIEALSWSHQVILQRLMELPVICGVAVMCVLQIRRLTPSDYRVHKFLRVAPVLLIGTWTLSVTMELAWPHPILDYFAKMPVKNWVLLTLLCAPLQFYLGLLAFLFFRAAGRQSPTRRLKLQNLLLAVSIGGYGLSYLNVLASYAVLACLDNPARTQVTLIQFSLETRLLSVWGPSLVGGLLLAAFPAAVREVRASDALALLPMRERFEGLLWRIEMAGSLRRLTRPLYHLRAAALELGISEADIAKAIQTVKLAAVMGSPKAPPGLSHERARELLSRLEESDELHMHLPVSWSSWYTRLFETSDPAHLPDILRAALHLTSLTVRFPRTLQSPWFDLARTVCIDIGITSEDSPEDFACKRTLEAYRRAVDQPLVPE